VVGVNTFCRWSANAIAFSSSLLAQLPSAFLIGGIEVWGRLSLFVAFHRVLSLGEREVRLCSKVALLAFLKAVCNFVFNRLYIMRSPWSLDRCHLPRDRRFFGVKLAYAERSASFLCRVEVWSATLLLEVG